MESADHKSKLFFKRLVGMETPEEQNELDALISSKPHLGKLPGELANYDNYRRRRERLSTIDVEKELCRIVAPRRRRMVGRVAAVLVPLVIAAGVGLLLLNRPDRRSAEPIMPASWGATLELSDGTAMELTGGTQTITLENGVAVRADSAALDYHAAADEPNAPACRNRLIVGRNQKYKLLLGDGTQVWLNSGSVLSYPVAFGPGERRVSIAGEAYFNVAHDTVRPFIVESGKGYEVEVLGTMFNVKAYPDDTYSETTLLEGSIGIKGDDGRRLVLTPSQQLRTDGDRREVRRVDPAYSITWTEGWFYFDDTPLDEALATLGRWYDVDFRFEDPGLKTISVSGKLQQFELSVILDMIGSIAGVGFDVDGRSVAVGKAER